MKKYLLSILLPLFLFLGMSAFAVTLIPVQQGGTGNSSFTSGYVLTGNGSGTISVTNPANWNTAYGWGDHSTQNYLDTDIHTLDDIPNGTTYKLLTAAKDGYINQDVTNGSSPSFLGLTLNSVGYSFPAADGTSGTFLRTDGAGTLSWQVSSGAGDMTKAVYDTNDNNIVDTATALASNGANCSAGNSPLGVDASGATEGCFDVWTEAENTSAGYISSVDGTELDGVFNTTGLLKRTGVATYSTITDNSTNWQTAYGWGDHSAQGYYNSLSDMTLATGNVYIGNASNNPTATSSIFILNEKVGVGTTTPSYALDVVGSIQTDTAFYGDYWISATGNNMAIQPTGDLDDFFSFKTPAHRPTIKREGGKYIYVESSNVNDVGLSFRKDADHSGTLNYYKDENQFGLTSKDPIVIKACEGYQDYVKFCNVGGTLPEITVASSTGLQINAGGINPLMLNHDGGNIAIGTTTAAYTLSLETGKSFGLGSMQWNSGDSIDADAIVDGATNAIPTLTQETNWDNAFGWGDWSGEGFLITVAYLDLTGNPSDVITAGTGLDWATDTLNFNSTGLTWNGNEITNDKIASSTEFLVDNDTTYISSDFTHDDLTGFVQAEHYNWENDLGATNIHTGNYPITDSEVPDDITIDLATVATTANAGDAAVDFFGAGVDAVTDATTCTDIEGTGLSITTSVLNWVSTGLDWIGNAIDISDYTNLAVTAPVVLTDDTLSVSAASATAAGVSEFATAAETTTGTDATRAITPDGLAGSSIFGRKTIQAVPIDWTATTTVADGIHYLHIPAELNGMNLVAVHAEVITAGTTGLSTWQIHNLTDTQDILSTKLTIDSTETGSDTAATPAVINTSYDDVATNDLLRIDCDVIQTTAAKGTLITLTFALP